MTARVANYLIAGIAMDPDRDFVTHRPGDHEHRRLFPQKLGHSGLQLSGGGILALLLVSKGG